MKTYMYGAPAVCQVIYTVGVGNISVYKVVKVFALAEVMSSCWREKDSEEG